MKRKVKRPFDNEQFRKGYVAGIFAAEKELNTELLHFAEKAHKIMSEGTFPDYGVKINFKDSNNTITTNLDMKTEEKAKKYDEALEWMRKVYPTLTGAAKEDAEHYFPELKESEDERIRKELIGLISCMHDADLRKKRWIAWIEKQKEQNTIPGRKTILGIWELGNIWKENPEIRDGLTQLQYIQKHWNEKCDYQEEQTTLEYLPKEKVYDIMSKLTELSCSKLISFNSEEYKKINEITCDVRSFLVYPIEQKFIEWSEEDEALYTAFICEVVNKKMNPTIEQIKWLRGIRDRLKSLRPRKQARENR